MSKHIPGPWVISPQGVGFEVETADGIDMIAKTQQLVGDMCDQSRRKANARLIAAAAIDRIICESYDAISEIRAADRANRAAAYLAKHPTFAKRFEAHKRGGFVIWSRYDLAHREIMNRLCI